MDIGAPWDSLTIGAVFAAAGAVTVWVADKLLVPLVQKRITSALESKTKHPILVRISNGEANGDPNSPASTVSLYVLNESPHSIYDVAISVRLVPLPAPGTPSDYPRALMDRVPRIPKEALSRKLFALEPEAGQFRDWNWMASYHELSIKITWRNSSGGSRFRHPRTASTTYSRSMESWVASEWSPK